MTKKRHFGLIDYWRMLKARGPKLPLSYFFNSHLFDIFHNIDTHLWIPKEQGVILNPNFAHGTFYMASWTSEISKSFYKLKKIIPDFESFTFIDIGAGKGKVVIVWQKLLNKTKLRQKIWGIDYDESLIAIAQKNFSRVFSTPGNFIPADATEFNYSECGKKLIVYLYNPFNEIILDSVLRKLTTPPRQIYVIYNNPVHASVLYAHGFEAIDKQLGFHPNCQTIIFQNTIT